MITISEDQKKVTVQKLVRLRFVESTADCCCDYCAASKTKLCDELPCQPSEREDKKDGYFVEVQNEHE